MTIIVMTNFLALATNEKKAFFDLTLSDPAALVIGSYFEYLRARKSKQSLYNDASVHYRLLHKNMTEFVLHKQRAEIVAADIISNELKITKKLEKKMENVKRKLDKVAEGINNHPKLKPQILTISS